MKTERIHGGPNGSRFRARIAVGVCTAVALVAFPLISSARSPDGSESLQCVAPAPTPTPTAPTPTPTKNPTPSPTPTPEPVQRVVTLSASEGTVGYGDTVELSGVLTSVDGTCRPNEKVQIMRQILGEEDQRPVGGETTDELGEFDASVKVQSSALYVAVATKTKDAAEAVSEPVTVLGRVEVVARTRSLAPERGTKFEITAKVLPEHQGSSAVLERKKDGNWANVKKDKADDSGFSFKVKANWKGKRVFRVTWLKSDEDHEPSSSNRLKIKTVAPRDDGGRGGGRR